ncbi:MAG TPA: hypothetical protein VMG10_10750 [Gemmataceae bacterium]|nr:hypothetical protein [Gemmataceae bacterium]
MTDERIVLTLAPSPSEVPVRSRLNRLLKAAARLGLRNVACTSGPAAWSGWLCNEKGGWTRTCAGCSPQIVLRLLAEAAEPSAGFCVLPTGVRPP